MELTKEEIESTIKSYVTKEELLNIINNIDFIAVKSMDLYALTCFMVRKNIDGNEYLDDYCKVIKID